MNTPSPLATAIAEFIAERLEAQFTFLGAEKYVHDPLAEWRSEVPGYRFETQHGTLELHPSLPIRLTKGERADYDLTVFGYFPDSERARASYGHWKWNHHFGYRPPEEIESCITYLVQRLSPMLIPSPTTQ